MRSGGDPLTGFIWMLCRARLAARLSPAQMAERIVASDYERIFQGVIGEWAVLQDFDDWQRAPSSNSATEAVKRAGKGFEVHWHGGTPVPGRWEACGTCRRASEEGGDPVQVQALVQAAMPEPLTLFDDESKVKNRAREEAERLRVHVEDSCPLE
jgi:hypothetical protein